MAIDLQSLLAPPMVTAQNPAVSPILNQNIPNVTYSAPSLMDHLRSAFQANPGGPTSVATNDPGFVGGLLPHGSGAQSFLGRLGDAFLIANGKEPIHRQFAQQQAEGAALSPMLQNGAFNPDGSISDAAHQSLAALAKINPQAAQQQQSQLIQSQLARAQLAREQAMSEATIAEKNATVQDKALGAARSLLLASNAQNYPAVKARAEQLLGQRGVDKALLGAPDAYDPDAVKSLAMAGVPVTRTFQMEETSQHHRAQEDVGQQNAASNRIRAGAQATSAGAQVTSAGARAQEAGTGAARLQNDILGGKTGPNTVHGGGGHHVFGGAGAAPVAGIVAPPPFAPGKAGRTVTNGTHTFVSPDGKTWNLKQ